MRDVWQHAAERNTEDDDERSVLKSMEQKLQRRRQGGLSQEDARRPWHGSAGEAPPRRYVRIPGRGSPQTAAPPPPGGVRHATGAEEILLASQPSYREALAEGKLQVAHVEYLWGWLQKRLPSEWMAPLFYKVVFIPGVFIFYLSTRINLHRV